MDSKGELLDGKSFRGKFTNGCVHVCFCVIYVLCKVFDNCGFGKSVVILQPHIFPGNYASVYLVIISLHCERNALANLPRP